MRTVELLGDDGLDRAVRAAWRRLDQAGLPSLARRIRPSQDELAARVTGPDGADGEFNRARSHDSTDRTVIPLLARLWNLVLEYSVCRGGQQRAWAGRECHR